MTIEYGKPKAMVLLDSGAASARFLSGEQAHSPPCDPIRSSPAYEGPRGRFWRCDLDAAYRKHGEPRENFSSLQHLVIEAPWAHSAWHSYFISLIHLRETADGRKPEFVYLDDATHEMILWAVDPKASRQQIIETGATGNELLTPKNFGAQFIEITDDLAIERVESAARQICHGTLSPDSDHRRDWAAMFGSNMIKREFR